MAVRPEELLEPSPAVLASRVRELQGPTRFEKAKEWAAAMGVGDVQLSRWKKGIGLSPGAINFIAKQSAGLGRLSKNWEEIRKFIWDGGPLPLDQTVSEYLLTDLVAA